MPFGYSGRISGAWQRQGLDAQHGAVWTDCIRTVNSFQAVEIAISPGMLDAQYLKGLVKQHDLNRFIQTV
jgi:hypothetical protein